MAMMCSGPVAQQPPTICAPLSIHSCAYCASWDGLADWAEMRSGPRWTRPPTGAIGLYPTLGYAPMAPSKAWRRRGSVALTASGRLHIRRIAWTGCPRRARASSSMVSPFRVMPSVVTIGTPSHTGRPASAQASTAATQSTM